MAFTAALFTQSYTIEEQSLQNSIPHCDKSGATLTSLIQKNLEAQSAALSK
jgi:hypothetical protein